MDDDALLEPATAGRLRLARAGEGAARRLRIGDLAPGAVGVLVAEVRGVSAVRPYNRRRGGQGLLCRVTLADATGEVDLVLWDDETRLAADGPFGTGRTVRLAGPNVRAGHRGGVELGLGSAEVAAVEAAPATATLRGVLAEVGATRPVGGPGEARFSAELAVRSEGGTFRVVVWDELVREARRIPLGAPVALEPVAPHPALEGWFTSTPATRLRNG